MFSMSLDLSLSGLLDSILAYFKERAALVILELLEQGRSENISKTETQDLNAMQRERILPRKKVELVSSQMELDSSRNKFLELKNSMVASNSKSDVPTDSILKQENRFSNFWNGEGLSRPGSKACSSLCKGKAVLQPGEAEQEQLNTLLKIFEEENDMMKQALIETVMERKELVTEICQLFQTLYHSLHRKDGSLIIKPSDM